MKKVLFATTALILTGGAAVAEVTVSGSGRFGIIYQESNVPGVNETQVSTRLRFNLDASTETESGVEFGGRIRLQYDNGDNDGSEAGAELSAARLYAKSGGFEVQVGNTDTAYDSAALMYNSEIGFIGRSFGNPSGSYFSFSSGPFDVTQANYMGVYASYSVGDFTGRISYVTPDQTGATVVDEEISISADYKFGAFTISAAAAMDGAGIADNDNYFVGAQYGINDNANVGLLYFDNGEIGGVEVGNTVTLYGNYGFGATTVRAYIANNDNAANVNDVAFGVGADYDLGGATLAGGVAIGYDENVTADLGVKFDF